MRSERVRGERNEKPESCVARLLESEQGWDCGATLHPSQITEEEQVWSISGHFVAASQGSACSGNKSPTSYFTHQDPLCAPPSTALLNPSHAQPCNLGEEFSGCYFY